MFKFLSALPLMLWQLGLSPSAYKLYGVHKGATASKHTVQSYGNRQRDQLDVASQRGLLG